MARKPSPIIPSSEKDRTGTAGILRRCNAQIRRRYEGLRRDVLSLFRSIEYLTVNRDEPVYIYQLTAEQQARLSSEIQQTLDRWIAAGRDPAEFFWFSPFVAEASQLGVAQSAANLAQLSASYAATRTLEEIVYSEPYRNRRAAAQLRSMDHWGGLSATMKSDLSSIIGRAVIDGKNPRTVEKEIAERLGVSMSKAQQYAQTEITGVLRDARAAEATYARDEMDIELALLWTSALKPITRRWHASRNGRTYSPEEVKDFYSRDGNRYNCFCAQVECLLDDDGKPMLSPQARQTFESARISWQSKYGK
jgi:hypothetical protein